MSIERKNRENLDNKRTNKTEPQENVEVYQKNSHACTWSPTEDKTDN